MRAACGFPSPAADYEAEEVTLDQLMVRNPLATILVEAAGDSMVEAGIFEGDLLVVDREVEPRSGSIVLACYDGSFTVKRLRLDPKGRIELHPENPLSGCGVLRPRPGEQFEVEGVVTGLARRLCSAAASSALATAARPSSAKNSALLRKRLYSRACGTRAALLDAVRAGRPP
ncbi:LexA family protein [Sutterella sp.]|uniref:LexA family protein n=1 Tax=Sutterella sp. TaxID=1981025 RepID=UPI003FD6FD91